YYLCVLDVSNAVEQFEEIALGGVERQVAYVETRRRDFNPLWLARRSRWLRTIPRLCCRSPLLAAVPEKFGNTLPERLFLRFRRSLRPSNAFVISSASAPTARATWASSG